MSYLILLLFILAIGGLAIAFAPSVASAYQTFKNSTKEKEKSDTKQKQREDEGIFVTLGRVILGDKTLDDAIDAERKQKEQEQITKDTNNYLIQEFGNKSKVNPKFQNKIVLTDSEKQKLGIPLDEILTEDSLLKYRQAAAKRDTLKRSFR